MDLSSKQQHQNSVFVNKCIGQDPILLPTPTPTAYFTMMMMFVMVMMMSMMMNNNITTCGYLNYDCTSLFMNMNIPTT